MQFRKRFGEEVKRKARDWDDKHPIDFLWRKAFKIPFGSKEHLEVSFIDQQIWYEEQVLWSKLVEKEKGSTAKGTQKVYDRGVDNRGLTEKDIEDIESKYTGEEGSKNLEALITKQTEKWQKASIEQS